MVQVNDTVNSKGIEEKLIELLKHSKMDQRAWSKILYQILACTGGKDISPPPLPVVDIQSSLKFPTKAGKLDTYTNQVCISLCDFITVIIFKIIHADIENCLALTKGNEAEIVTQITYNSSYHGGKIIRIASRGSLRRLQMVE